MSEAGPSTVSPSQAMVGEQSRKVKRSRLGKREKKQLRETTAVEGVAEALPLREDGLPATDAWSWYPLADRLTATCPVIFDPECSYCFIATGSSVRVYTVATAQLLSTLTLSPSTSTKSSDGSLRRAKVSCLLLNPANPLQLVVGALDGSLRLWDYREGKLLRTLDLGAPIQHATGHESLPNQIFVALTAPKDGPSDGSEKKKNASRKDQSDEEEEKAGIYSISLKPKALPEGIVTSGPTTPRTPARRMRLAQPRVIRQLSLSPTGAFLISLNPTAVNICRTSALEKGFTTHLESTEALTCLAFHPKEDYFATGNVKGQIRMWYGVLSADVSAGKSTTPAKDTASSLLHWHAHPVAALSFTPNGAYLFSGGEEAVLVLWQLHTGHREFVPRVGAAISTLSVTTGVHDEQQVVARLRDGSVIFIGSQKLKISHSIAGMKADPARLSDVTNRKQEHHQTIPIALQPLTKSLVIPSAHPSSLQFYSPITDSQTLELEISPSNRVTAAGTPLEPTRVERVAFSTPEKKGNGGYWMATLDSWESGAYTPERHLKFWRFDPETASFSLTTRIDLPHSDKLTSLTFSPSPSHPILLTTSLDTSIKLWSPVTSPSISWACRSSLSYRAFVPIDAAWSHDGSMFSIAHSTSVSLWSLAEGKVLHSFGCAGVGEVRRVEFVGPEGTTLVAAGKDGVVAWDLLTFEETSAVPLSLSTLSSRPGTSTLFTTSSSHTATPSSTTHLIDVASSDSPSVIHRPLPIAVRQALFLDSLLPSSTSSSPDEVALAVVDDQGAVFLVGGLLATSLSRPHGAAPLPEAGKGQSRLFEDIFGASSAVQVPELLEEKVSEMGNESGGMLGRAGLEMLDAPSHTLPPAKMLWRSMLAGLVAPSSRGASATGGEFGRVVDGEGEEEKMDVEEEEAFVGYEEVDGLAEALKAGLSLRGSSSQENVSIKAKKGSKV